MTDLAVIMSIYKQDKLSFVKESVQSILSQTYRDFHYYLIFDGPVSQEIEQYISSIRDKRIKLYRLEKNSGLAIAMNTLLDVIIRIPDYRYIARMDADDISMAERFQVQRDFLIDNPTIFCVGSWYREIDEEGSSRFVKKLPLEHNEIVCYMRISSPLAHPTVMFRSGFFSKAGFYPTNTHRMEDYALWVQAFKSNIRFANIPMILLSFRIDKDFYRRRSGMRYGYGYIKTRFRIIKLLDLPLNNYLYSISSGIGKMMPSLLVSYIYAVVKRMAVK